MGLVLAQEHAESPASGAARPAQKRSCAPLPALSRDRVCWYGGRRMDAARAQAVDAGQTFSWKSEPGTAPHTPRNVLLHPSAACDTARVWATPSQPSPSGVVCARWERPIPNRGRPRKGLAAPQPAPSRCSTSQWSELDGPSAMIIDVVPKSASSAVERVFSPPGPTLVLQPPNSACRLIVRSELDEHNESANRTQPWSSGGPSLPGSVRQKHHPKRPACFKHCRQPRNLTDGSEVPC
jgi:hypothetical protein